MQWLKKNPEANPSRVRLKRVFRTTSVRRERFVARSARPRVNDNSFDGSQRRCSQPSILASRSRLSTCISRGHESSDDAIDNEALEAQEEAAPDAPL